MDTIRDLLLTGIPGHLFRGHLERALNLVGRDVACLGILLGVVCLIFGWRWFRTLLAIQTALVGFYFGFALGNYALVALSCGVVLAALAGFLSWKHTRPTSAAVVGLYAASVASGLFLSHPWITASHADWLGVAAGTGIGVAAGLLVYYAQHPAVTLLTAVHGAAGVLGGLVALLLAFDVTHKYAMDWLRREPLLLPVSILVLGGIGIVYQWHFGGKSTGGAGSASSESKPAKHPAEKRKRMAA